MVKALLFLQAGPDSENGQLENAKSASLDMPPRSGANNLDRSVQTFFILQSPQAWRCPDLHSVVPAVVSSIQHEAATWSTADQALASYK